MLPAGFIGSGNLNSCPTCGKDTFNQHIQCADSNNLLPFSSSPAFTNSHSCLLGPTAFSQPRALALCLLLLAVPLWLKASVAAHTDLACKVRTFLFVLLGLSIIPPILPVSYLSLPLSLFLSVLYKLLLRSQNTFSAFANKSLGICYKGRY